MGFETQDVERKTLAMIKILSESEAPLGSRIISQRLKDRGIELDESTVRYHLRLMDERGLTQLSQRRDGRMLTQRGIEEVRSALVKDKVGSAISRIEQLAFRTSFDFEKRCGEIPVNVSFFPNEKFSRALHAMKSAFKAGICVSDLVATAAEGERLGGLAVPKGKTGLATVCSVVVNGALLKASVPVGSRFGGILQMRNHLPLRFVELIHYAGCSLDPAVIFIRARMTSVGAAVNKGDGNILANFNEIPALCRPTAEDVMNKLNQVGLRGLLVMGDTSEPVCEVSPELNKIAMVLSVGLNAVAAAEEAGVEAENHSMSTLIAYKDLIRFDELLDERG